MDDEKCGCCGHGHEEDAEELTTEELAVENNIMLNALVDVLVKKGIITEDELNDRMDEIDSELEEGEGSDDDSDDDPDDDEDKQ